MLISTASLGSTCVEGFKKVALPGLPWSPEFMAARELALNDSTAKIELDAKRTVAGTVSAGLVSYYQSATFTRLAASSQKMRRAELERFRAESRREAPAAHAQEGTSKHSQWQDASCAAQLEKSDARIPGPLLALDMIKVDPLAGVTLSKIKTAGHHPWESWECEKFEAHHAIGTRARLACELLLQAGQSKCDVVRMGRQHIRKGMMKMRRQKTGVPFNVEITPRLQTAIDAMPESNHLTFLVTAQGEPFTAAPVSATAFVIFASQPSCRPAAPPKGGGYLPRRAGRNRPSTHGVVRLGGSISQAQVYTKEANRKRMAMAAGKLISGTGIGSPIDPVSQIDDQPVENIRSRK